MFCFDDFMDHKSIDVVPSDPDNKRLTRPRTIGGFRVQKCEICGDFAYSRHFRVTSCRACAAFFRRSVALRRSYTCSRNHECEIRASRNSRHFCRFCRFQRCVQSGMNLNAIVERDADEYRCFPVNSPIRKALMAQKASFVNRYTAHLNLCDGNHTLVRMGKENPQLANIVTVKSEFPVLIQYLVGSGFEDCNLNQEEIFNLGKELFYTWISYTSIIATMKNSGHKLNFSYFIDESFVKATDNEVQHFVHTCPNLLDYNMAARATIDCCSENITSAARLHQMRMDDVEHSVLFQIYALNTAIRMFPHHQELRRSLDQVFDQIKQHYLRNFEDVSVKMGSMILMLSQLSHWTEFLQEYVSYLYLTGYSPVLSKLKSSAEVKVKTEMF